MRAEQNPPVDAILALVKLFKVIFEQPQQWVVIIIIYNKKIIMYNKDTQTSK